MTFINETSERILHRLNSEASDLNQALGLFQSYMSQMCDEYDRRNLSQKQTVLSKACVNLARDNQILKKAVVIMD